MVTASVQSKQIQPYSVTFLYHLGQAFHGRVNLFVKGMVSTHKTTYLSCSGPSYMKLKKKGVYLKKIIIAEKNSEVDTRKEMELRVPLGLISFSLWSFHHSCL